MKAEKTLELATEVRQAKAAYDIALVRAREARDVARATEVELDAADDRLSNAKRALLAELMLEPTPLET